MGRHIQELQSFYSLPSEACYIAYWSDDVIEILFIKKYVRHCYLVTSVINVNGIS